MKKNNNSESRSQRRGTDTTRKTFGKFKSSDSKPSGFRSKDSSRTVGERPAPRKRSGSFTDESSDKKTGFARRKAESTSFAKPFTKRRQEKDENSGQTGNVTRRPFASRPKTEGATFTKPYAKRNREDEETSRDEKSFKKTFESRRKSDSDSFKKPYNGRSREGDNLNGDEKSTQRRSSSFRKTDTDSYSNRSSYPKRATDSASKSWTKEKSGDQGENKFKKEYSEKRSNGFKPDRRTTNDSVSYPKSRNRQDGEEKSFERKKRFSDKGTDKNTENRPSNKSGRISNIGNAPFNPKSKPKTTPDYDLKKYGDRRKNKDSEKEESTTIRLNRYIANSGVCSRRDADVLIESGEIKVNGNVITELGFQVKPGDVVKYGNRVLNREKMVYILLNKPKDFITTTDDPDERRTVMDLVKEACDERIFPVGRLDRNTTGLLLMTNDGELSDKLSHPSNNVKKIYSVELDKPITAVDFEKIKQGVVLEDGPAPVDDVAIVSPDAMLLGIELHLGRNRIVRRIFEHLGYEVVKLDRVMYAGLTKKDLPRGNWRFLSEKEVIKLKYLI
jgi:23S rRNA pseudouridine2605 synthase